MAGSSHIFFALWLAAIVLVLSARRCEGTQDEEEMKKSCKPGETFGCKSGSPGCGENTCGVERRGPCSLDCHQGCWCRGKMYRRKRDNKCVPKHECLL
uniref:TIL domain containing protein n=1 Tax=Rhipicephalus zambeziensis TaxID=60191 RepID=A0A224YPE7_9ACAR